MMVSFDQLDPRIEKAAEIIHTVKEITPDRHTDVESGDKVCFTITLEGIDSLCALQAYEFDIVVKSNVQGEMRREHVVIQVPAQLPPET